MSYRLGDGELGSQIDALIAAASDHGNEDLIREMLVTVLKLHRDRADRADLLQINTALKELRYTNLAFSRYRQQPKVTIFGSARIGPEDPNYQTAKAFGAAMAGLGWGVITGAGPGVMAAGNEGAGRDMSYGVKIRLPFESEPNEFLDPSRTINYKYFFTRKLGLVKEAHGFAMLPGGFGTMDEVFEFLTLVQTGKSDMHPIVLLEAPGGGYWRGFTEFIQAHLVSRGLVLPEDLGLFLVTDSVTAAVDEIAGFYRNYQSQRYVGQRLVLRLIQAPDDDRLEALTEQFSDILVSGRIERTVPSAAEEAEADSLALDRVAFDFDRRHFGQLRSLINELNETVPTSRPAAPPQPFTQEQQHRDW